MQKYLQIFIGLSILFIHNIAYAIYPPPVVAKHGMVVSAQYLASQAGVDILKQGGNAIDAAVAVGYALSVVYPSAGNLGGGGFMLIHFAKGNNIFLNFREKAPLAATSNMYLDTNGRLIPDASLLGFLASGVPGTVLGLNTALKKYGSMPLATVMAPAIKLAQNGFILSPVDAQLLQEGVQDFMIQPNIRAIFINHDHPYRAGERLIQTDLANTLKLIAKNGSDAFYKGPIADTIVAAEQQQSGIMTKQDLANYTVEELTPVQCSYRGFTVISSPPPSSGGTTLCETLNILEGYRLGHMGFHSAKSLHYLIEALRYAYYDRNNYLGDPDFVQDPVGKLTSKEYAAAIRKKIQPVQATSSLELPGVPIPEGPNTTHYSIVDAQDNAVSVTYTLNNVFGARVIAGNTGFFLNDEMDDFTTKIGEANAFGLVQGSKNSIAPGKRPLSSMTPTIVLKDNKIFMVLGSPAGSAIITSVLQTILNVIDFGMDIKTAVDMPRIHFQWLPDNVWYESFGLSRDTRDKLAIAGYHLILTACPLGDVAAILVDQFNNSLYGASDDRIPTGKALGY